MSTPVAARTDDTKLNSLKIVIQYSLRYPEVVADETMGRRARKNAQTRGALADAARKLFLDNGYDAVSVKDIADAVDISVPTFFNHVPDGKAAVMFDDGAERRQSLLAAVRDRKAGQSVIAALREYFSGRGPFVENPAPGFAELTQLIMATPALRDYSRTLWIRCERPLAAAIADELGRDPGDAHARALARYVLEIPDFVGDDADPLTSLNAVFDLLEYGAISLAAAPTRSRTDS